MLRRVNPEFYGRRGSVWSTLTVSSETQFCSFTIDFCRDGNGKSLIFKNYKDSIGSIIVGLLWLSSIIGVAFFCGEDGVSFLS